MTFPSSDQGAVLVLGGTGFLGARVARALVRRGFAPVLASRRPAAVRLPWRRCDASILSETRAAMRGVAGVVNCLDGARTALPGVANLFTAAAELGVRRVVHVSSMAVYAPRSGPVGEGVPLLPPGRTYAGAKAAAEALAEGYAAAGGRVTVLRPGCVYGAGGERWTGRLARLLGNGRLGDCGLAGERPSNLVHVEDVARAAVEALERDLDGAFNLVSPEAPSWNRYLRDLAGVVDAPFRSIGSPRLWLETRIGVPALKGARRLACPFGIADAVPEPFPVEILEGPGAERRLDGHLAEATFGFPRTGMRETMDEIGRWLARARDREPRLTAFPRPA